MVYWLGASVLRDGHEGACGLVQAVQRLMHLVDLLSHAESAEALLPCRDEAADLRAPGPGSPASANPLGLTIDQPLCVARLDAPASTAAGVPTGVERINLGHAQILAKRSQPKVLVRPIMPQCVFGFAARSSRQLSVIAGDPCPGLVVSCTDVTLCAFTVAAP